MFIYKITIIKVYMIYNKPTTSTSKGVVDTCHEHPDRCIITPLLVLVVLYII